MEYSVAIRVFGQPPERCFGRGRAAHDVPKTGRHTPEPPLMVMVKRPDAVGRGTQNLTLQSPEAELKDEVEPMGADRWRRHPRKRMRARARPSRRCMPADRRTPSATNNRRVEAPGHGAQSFGARAAREVAATGTDAAWCLQAASLVPEIAARPQKHELGAARSQEQIQAFRMPGLKRDALAEDRERSARGGETQHTCCFPTTCEPLSQPRC